MLVRGVVVDQNGETVIGASVVVKGTTNGTITGLDGDFSIPNVKKGDVIVVSYVGYMNSEIIWEGKPLKIALKEDSKTLDEVVVVGYATVKKANLTGAVSAVDDKVLADRPIVNLGQGLQGTIPNLNITTSGQPGKGSSFNVRGETSINGGSPLVLVDGVQMDPNLINPQDVASVSVLRMQLLPLSMEPVPLMVLSLSQPRAAARICLHKCHSMHLSHSTARQPVRNI